MININQEMINTLVAEFRESLKKGKLVDGKISFTKKFDDVKERAKLWFTESAWIKMTSLVKVFDKEVAWHGVASRIDDSDNEYVISDIMVYPQRTTAATVDMDVDEYAKWLTDNIDTPGFMDIRMQGHSHVNMGTSPSSVDLQHQEDILSMLGDDDFYIFLIWNKKGDRTVRIFDMQKNMLYETSDVDISIVGNDYALSESIEKSQQMILPPKTEPVTQKTTDKDKSIGFKNGDKRRKGKMKKGNVFDGWCNTYKYGYFSGE